MSLVGGNPAPEMMGVEELPGKSNYFIGREPEKWRSGIPNYRKVAARNVYPSIDLVYYGSQRQIEYDFTVAPGADPRMIRLALETGNSKIENGNSRVSIDTSGDLVIGIGGGELRFHKPLVYQEQLTVDSQQLSATGHRKPIDARYVLRAADSKSKIENLKYEVGFEIAAYDRTKPLIIDPVLSYSTYLGGSNIDAANAIAVSNDGTAFIAGETDSTDFPTAHALQPNAGGPRDFPDDAFVAKLSADGSTLLYSTYLGGGAADRASGIAVDTFGDAFLTGTTLSSDFPTTPGSFHPNCGCDGKCNTTIFGNGLISSDAFVTELNPAGSAIIYSSLVSGLGNTRGLGIAVDNNGNAYVTGATDAVACPAGPPFPIPGSLAPPFQPNLAGSEDGFIVKVDPTGSSIPYGSYLGGSGEDDGFGIAADNTNLAYLTGLTCSSDFPVLNSLQAYGGNCDAFVTKFDTSQSGAASLVYSTYLGGSAKDQGNAIALDKPPGGDPYVTGVTNSTNFPTTGGVIQATCALDSLGVCEGDAFVTKLTGTPVPSVAYSTFFGGSGADTGSGIAVDTAGNAYITGFTNSTQSSSPTPFPTAGSPFQPTYGGGNTDAFVAKLNPTATGLVYSSFLGGSNADNGTGIAVDSLANAYVTGQTCSTNFPTHLPEQGTPGGNCDAFVSKILVGPDISMSPTSLVFSAQPVGTTSTPQTITLTSNGDSNLVLGTVTVSGQFTKQSDSCSGVTLAPSAFCNVSVSFAPTTSGPQGGTLTIPDNVPGSPQTIPLSGLVTNVFALPTQLNFGNQLVGATSTAQTVTLTNASGSTLSIFGIDTSGDFAQYASGANPCSNTLSAGLSCTVAVTFTPTAAGIRSGTLTFTDSDSSGTQTVTLTGHGNAPVVSLSTGTLNFGTQGATGPAQTVNLANVGDGALQIDTISISSPFAQTNNCPTNPAYLAAGAFCAFTVTFDPTAPGTFTGQLTITDTASGSPQSVALSGTAQVPVASLVPTSLTFEQQAVNTTSSAQSVVLSNTGNATLNIGGISLSGTNRGDFAFVSSCGATLTAGAGCTVNVTFTPTAAGTRVASLIFIDDAASSPQSVPISGVGVTVPSVTLSPLSLTFPDTRVGVTSAVQTVGMTNSGSATLLISSITVGGTNPSDFAQSNTCGASLSFVAPNNTCTISVTFTPTGSGSRYGTLTVTDNAGNSPQTIPLAGNGLPAPVVTLSPTAVTFADQGLNTMSSAQTVQLTNTGNASLTITSVTVTGANAGDFQLTNFCAGTILPGAAPCTMTVTFTPTASGARLAAISIVDNAPNSPQSVPLSGNGVLLPAVSFSPTSLAFPSQAVGTPSSALPVVLTNSGLGPLTFTAPISIAGANAGDFSQTNNCPATLAAGLTCTINVIFTPSAAGTRVAALSVTDNAPGSPQTVPLTGGAATAPGDYALAVDPTAATIFAGSTANFALTVTSVAGFTGNVKLSCTGAPRQAVCVVNPATATPPATVAVSIQTTARVQAPPGSSPILPPSMTGLRWLSWAFSLVMMATILAARRRRALLVFGLLMLFVLLWTACGGGGQYGVPNGTPAGTYTLTITGVSGSSTKTTTVTLTVN